MNIKRFIFSLITLTALQFAVGATSLEKKPEGAHFEKFKPLKAPKVSSLQLKQDDRLAICGDSITEQKKYSRIMETYLTVALPELNISTRQYGWSGEQAPGFLHRMTSDVLRFNPTIATTCYGMNDHHYRPYDKTIGDAYRSNSLAIVESFKHAHARVIQGSPGCMGPTTGWAGMQGTADDRNLNLCELRNIGVEIAQKENVGFADVFWPMYEQEYFAREKFGTNYALAGKDSVHPDWAGHVVMAYAFLKALGVQGDIGTITVDLKSNLAKATQGHEILSMADGKVTVKSSRYPFCAVGKTDDYKSIRSGMTLVPFNQEFNRFILVVKKFGDKPCKITWGDQTKTFQAGQLKKGINLADEFDVNPFSDAFNRVDEAVAKKQAFETKQIKETFRSAAAKADMEKTVAETEAQRAPLVAAIKTAFVPVTHTITITPID